MDQHEFVRRALSLVGQSYGECDCIGVVRKAANIKCQGTNWLWRSIFNSPKYRYLVERSVKPLTPDRYEDGLLVFRIRFDQIPKGYTDTPDCHHVGVLGFNNGRWEVIQSNPSPGVTNTGFSPSQWDGWGKLKMIDYAGPAQPDPQPDPETDGNRLDEIYRMVKVLYDAYMRGMEAD